MVEMISSVRAVFVVLMVLGAVECGVLAAFGLVGIYAGVHGLAFLAGVPAKHLLTADIPLEYPKQTLIKSSALIIVGIPFAAGCGLLTIQAVLAGWRLLRE
jgi:hypothetical protein